MRPDATILSRQYTDLRAARLLPAGARAHRLELREAAASAPAQALARGAGAQEVEAIRDAAPSPRFRAAFMLCYGSGLRTDDVVHLEPRHVDSQRMVIRVERGKGKKDRQVMLCEPLLCELPLTSSPCSAAP
jgi:integrase